MSNKLYTRTGPKAFPAVFKTAVVTANSSPTGDSKASIRDSIHVGSVEVGNSTGADASCGFGYQIPNSLWKAGQWDNSAGASYTDDTTDAQDAGTTDFPMTTAGQADDGFVVQASTPFNVLGMDITTAGAGGSIASPIFQYWNGSAWTTLTPILAGDFTETTADPGSMWLQPLDEVALATGDTPVDTDGLDAGKYAIKVSWAATAPTTAPVADSIWIGQLMDYIEQVEDGKAIKKEYKNDMVLPFDSNLVAFCNVANAANWIDVEYRLGA